jgi:regulatory protein
MRKQKQLTTYDDVKEKALRLLEFRSHSEKELIEKLRRAGACDEHIETVLELCRRYGFVDDEAFAKRKAQDLFNLKKYGIRRIKTELKMLGIADEYIDGAISELDDEKELNSLGSLLEKKLKNDFSEKNKNKCIRYFIYRGYDIYDIKDTIRNLEENYEV